MTTWIEKGRTVSHSPISLVVRRLSFPWGIRKCRNDDEDDRDEVGGHEWLYE